MKLISGENFRKYAGPKNLDYVQKMNKGWSYFSVFTPERNAQAQRMCKEAIMLEPEDALACEMLGWTYLMNLFFGVSKSSGEDLERVFGLAQKAIEINDAISGPHVLLPYFYLANREYEKAVAEAEQAVALSPNSVDARAHKGNIFRFSGKKEEAVNLSKQAIRQNPFPQPYYFTFLGVALCYSGKYEEAIEAYNKARHLNPKDNLSRLGLVLAYRLSGNYEEPRAIAAEILLINPSFSVKRWAIGALYKNQADTELIANTMLKVGLPG